MSKIVLGEWTCQHLQGLLIEIRPTIPRTIPPLSSALIALLSLLRSLDLRRIHERSRERRRQQLSGCRREEMAPNFRTTPGAPGLASGFFKGLRLRGVYFWEGFRRGISTMFHGIGSRIGASVFD
jgi:hypothetical protein